jgi:hypothetical protein
VFSIYINKNLFILEEYNKTNTVTLTFIIFTILPLSLILGKYTLKANTKFNIKFNSYFNTYY